MSLWPVLKLYLLLVVASGAQGLDLLEFIFGPRLGKVSVSSRFPPRVLEKFSDAENFVRLNGYPFEVHEVTTEDGYILELHRIPSGRIAKNRNNTSRLQRPPVLFQHGLLAASDTWLFRGRDQDLPYILADAGYDVWLSNMRGNVYSRRHTKLDPDLDPEYWKYSIHEMGYYDLPATIDHILTVTRQKKLYAMGHSVGSSAIFILGAVRPEYNSKIKLHLALAPWLNVLHKSPFAHKLLMTPMLSATQLAVSQNILNVLPRREYFSRIVELICKNGSPLQSACLGTAFTLVGTDYEMFNSSYFPQVATYYPAGTSVYVAMHVLEIYKEGTFRPLDYKNLQTNLEKYKESPPKPYDLSLVTHPVSLHYGQGDLLVTEEDINFSMKILPNVIGKFSVPFKKFNHMDFMWGLRAKEYLYNKLVVIMDKYR